MPREINSIGVVQNYGPRSAPDNVPYTNSTYGPVRVLEVVFDYADANAGLPTINAENDASVLPIPANSLIKSAQLHVTTAFTSDGAATLELGTQETDGTVIDADGLDSLAVAALTVNSWHVLDGALVGATSGTVDSQIAIDDGTAVFTAGEARLLIEYVPPVATA